MVSVKFTSLILAEGITRAMVKKELLSGAAVGTRKAVKISMKIGKKTRTGYVSRELLNWHAVRGVIKPKKVLKAPKKSKETSGPGNHATKGKGRGK
jgi:hypothetical protein